MKTSPKNAILVAGTALLIGMTGVMADEGKPNQGKPDDGRYVLKDGTSHDTPGEMFQYLRDRDNGLAAGNPKDIVNAYPDEFDNVGELIHQKREPK